MRSPEQESVLCAEWRSVEHRSDTCYTTYDVLDGNHTFTTTDDRMTYFTMIIILLISDNDDTFTDGYDNSDNTGNNDDTENNNYSDANNVVATTSSNIIYEQNKWNTNTANQAYPGYCKHVLCWRPTEKKALAYLAGGSNNNDNDNGNGYGNCKGQWRGTLMFSLICAWINGWVNNQEACDLRRNRAHYDVTVIYIRKKALLSFIEIHCRGYLP